MSVLNDFVRMIFGRVASKSTIILVIKKSGVFHEIVKNAQRIPVLHLSAMALDLQMVRANRVDSKDFF